MTHLTAAHPLLAPRPVGASRAEWAAWLDALERAVRAWCPAEFTLTLAWDPEPVPIPFRLHTSADAYDLVYQQAEPFAVTAGGRSFTVPAGSVQVAWGVFGLSETREAVGDGSVADALERALDRSCQQPQPARIQRVLGLHQMIYAQRSAGPKYQDLITPRQVRLAAEMCARDDRHRSVLAALFPQWPGTVAELLDTAEAVLVR